MESMSCSALFAAQRSKSCEVGGAFAVSDARGAAAEGSLSGVSVGRHHPPHSYAAHRPILLKDDRRDRTRVPTPEAESPRREIAEGWEQALSARRHGEQRPAGFDEGEPVLDSLPELNLHGVHSVIELLVELRTVESEEMLSAG